eukprot:tig00001007_g6236.t1
MHGASTSFGPAPAGAWSAARSGPAAASGESPFMIGCLPDEILRRQVLRIRCLLLSQSLVPDRLAMVCKRWKFKVVADELLPLSRFRNAVSPLKLSALRIRASDRCGGCVLLASADTRRRLAMAELEAFLAEGPGSGVDRRLAGLVEREANTLERLARIAGSAAGGRDENAARRREAARAAAWALGRPAGGSRGRPGECASLGLFCGRTGDALQLLAAIERYATPPRGLIARAQAAHALLEAVRVLEAEQGARAGGGADPAGLTAEQRAIVATVVPRGELLKLQLPPHRRAARAFVACRAGAVPRLVPAAPEAGIELARRGETGAGPPPRANRRASLPSRLRSLSSDPAPERVPLPELEVPPASPRSSPTRPPLPPTRPGTPRLAPSPAAASPR